MGKMTRRNLGVQALRTLIVWAFGLQLGATKRCGKGRLQNDVFMIDLRDFPKRPLALSSLRSSRSESLFFVIT